MSKMSDGSTAITANRGKSLLSRMHPVRSTSTMSADASLPASVLRRIKAYPLFYQKVWLACARIPRGSVMTYKQLAAAIGHPGAARAVGTALGRNPCAPRIPCHRVIASDGSLGGYSRHGGVRKKKKLLERERCRGV